MTQRSPPWMTACAAGVLWGIATPGFFGSILALAGSTFAARAVTGRIRTDALHGLLLGILWYGPALGWLPDVWDRFAGGSGHPVYFGTVLLQTTLPVAALTLTGYAVRRGWSPPLAAMIAWAITEPLLSYLQPLPAGPSMVLIDTPILLGPAPIGGRALVTSALVGWGATLAHHPPRALPYLATWMLLSAWTSTLGAPSVHQTTRIGIVQPQVGAFDGRRSSTAEARSRTLLELVDRAASSGARWVVTPEGAWPLDVGASGGHRRAKLAELWRERPPTLLGVNAPGPELPYNALWVMEGTSPPTAEVHKRSRVPLAERALGPLGRTRYHRGETSAELSIAGIRVGALICYEDLSPSAVARAARSSQILVAATHDAWLHRHRASEQHLVAARWAALTTGRWLVRPASSGVSAVVDPRGRLRWRLPWVDGDRPDAPPGAAAVFEIPLSEPSPSPVPWFWPALAGCTLMLGRTTHRELHASHPVTVVRRERRFGLVRALPRRDPEGQRI